MIKRIEKSADCIKDKIQKSSLGGMEFITLNKISLLGAIVGMNSPPLPRIYKASDCRQFARMASEEFGFTV